MFFSSLTHTQHASLLAAVAAEAAAAAAGQTNLPLQPMAHQRIMLQDAATSIQELQGKQLPMPGM